MRLEVAVSKRYVLSEYVDLAMGQAHYDSLRTIPFRPHPSCPGYSPSPDAEDVKRSYRSTLEDWVLVGLKLRHHLPIIGNIDLNKEPAREPVDSL